MISLGFPYRDKYEGLDVEVILTVQYGNPVTNANWWSTHVTWIWKSTQLQK